MILNDVYTQLKSDTTVNGMVAGRILFGVDRNMIMPSIILELQRMGDTAINQRELQRYTLGLTCSSLVSFNEARDLGDACYKALNRKTFGAIKSIALQDQVEAAVSDGGDPDKIFFSQIVTFSLLAAED